MLFYVCTAANDCDIYEDRTNGDMVLMSNDRKNIIRIKSSQFAGFLENVTGYIDERQFKTRGAARYYESK
jgi:hypothetical protein